MTNYRRGADFERRARDRLVEQGFLVFRSAGSHSLADLVAIDSSGKAWLVQCKSGARKISGAELEALRQLASDWHCGAMVVRRGMVIERV